MFYINKKYLYSLYVYLSIRGHVCMGLFIGLITSLVRIHFKRQKGYKGYRPKKMIIFVLSTVYGQRESLEFRVASSCALPARIDLHWNSGIPLSLHTPSKQSIAVAEIDTLCGHVSPLKPPWVLRCTLGTLLFLKSRFLTHLPPREDLQCGCTPT